MADSTKSGPVSSMKGQKQHGPSTWWLVRCPSKSEGFTRDPSIMGLTNSQLEFESTRTDSAVLTNAKRSTGQEICETVGLNFGSSLLSRPIFPRYRHQLKALYVGAGGTMWVGCSRFRAHSTLYMYFLLRHRVPPFRTHRNRAQIIVLSALPTLTVTCSD